MTSIDGWKLSRVLGTGGFGIVELWTHVQSGKKIALKKCKLNYSQLTSTQLERWTKEVEIMKHLKHPNIVKTIPFKLPNVKENLPVLYMEYCRKGDLRKVVSLVILNQPENCCGIIETEAIKVMNEISSAVEYLHSCNITHRDLKPENIVLQDEQNMITYKLIDLGYAKELGEASTSASLVGTLNYVAPELLWTNKYSRSVDYWSLGILFYEVVTGIRPFLPTMQHTKEWMEHIRNKSYDDIHAYKSEGKVMFGKDIQNPTHLPDCLRNKMVQWFRLVLQWDPHKRGKILDRSGMPQIAVFTMLQHALSKKILNIFCVLFYKIITYEIEDTTTLGDLQLLIERDTNIEIKNQLLTDYKGAVLIENNVSLKSQTNDHVFFLFRNGCCSIEDISISNIPAAVKEMMTQSRNELNSEILKDYYRHTIYFVKKEMYLFQLYIFALNINVDLFQQKIDMFNTNVEKTLENIKILIDQVHIIRMKYVNTTDENATNKKKVEIFDKVDKLINAANKIKVKFISLKEDNNRLIDKARDIDYIGNLSELYDKMCNVYLKFKQESPYKPTMPLDMVKLMFTFLTAREKQLYSQNIIDITSQLQELQDKLSKLEMIFISVTAMTEFYWKEYQKIAQSDTIDNNISQQSNIHQSLNISTIDLGSIIQSEDNVIYDNLIIRYKMDNLMAEMQKNYFEMVNLNP